MVHDLSFPKLREKPPVINFWVNYSDS